MKTYEVRISGPSFIQSLEMTRDEMSDEQLIRWAERALPTYHPTYYRLEAWEKSVDPKIPGRVVCLFATRIVAVRV